MAVSVQGMADQSRATALIARNESRLNRIHQRAHQTFLELRKAVASGLLKPARPEVQPAPSGPGPAGRARKAGKAA